MGIAFELMASVGKYTSNGEEKTRWQRVGAVFEKDGRLSIKLDAIPVGNEWNGWLSCFEPKQRDAPQQSSKNAYAKASGGGMDDMADDVPW